jgi:lysozyme
MDMKTSQKGVDLIKSFEGLRNKAYVCPAGVLTIGYGSTGPHVKTGMWISDEQAEALLRKDLARFERTVAQVANSPTQPQFDALVSFAFNVGTGALKSSTLLKRHNAGDIEGAANQFLRWVKAGRTTLPGLVRRRAAERKLYLEG